MGAKNAAFKKLVHEGELVPPTPVARSVTDLDRLIHERMRLGIVSALAANSSLTFNDLKKLLRTTDGNLSVHARKLEEAGYIACSKSFEGRVPKTENGERSGPEEKRKKKKKTTKNML